MRSFKQYRRFRAAVGASVIASMTMGSIIPSYAEASHTTSDRQETATPIKHVVVIIGENRGFDHIFATYKPKHGQKVSNLLSRGIVQEDGTPGRHYVDARQYLAAPQSKYYITTDDKTPYVTLPPPELFGGVNNVASDAHPLPFVTESAAVAAEPSLEPGDVHLLTTGATGLPATTGVDSRVTDAFYLRNGPYQLTGPFLPYNSLTGDMIHSFHQMWQQSDCSVSHATRANPSGCLNDLYPFVAVTSAATSQGGGTPMAFYNVNQGDAPYLKQLADEYTMSDNYHQAQMGGSTVEHLYLAMADTIYYSDGRGNPAQPPAARIANPDPVPGTVNQYTGGGAQYVACADPSQPGVAPIVNYLQSLPRPLNPNCAPGYYYLINNLLPGYNIDGTINVNPKAVPPSNVRTIGDALGENNLSFRYYAGGYNDLVAGKPNRYCGVCNPFQFMSSVMSNSSARAEHLKDATDFFSDLSKGTLPTVAFVKPSGYLDGHPGGSTVDLFEAFVKHIVDDVKADPKLFAETAIFITFDEAGGYYDSGYIQPLDFQGDGPRIPLIVVSPFTRGGRIVHSYSDHASIVKFIERNWHLAPLSNRSRDNLPNPIAEDDNPYVPVNSPAIGDLFDLFDIDHAHDHDDRGRHEHDRGESGDDKSSR